jgi:hypothetical protein
LARRATNVEQTGPDRERRPIGRSYVITQGTFLIGSLGNYLIADTRAHRAGNVVRRGADWPGVSGGPRARRRTRRGRARNIRWRRR